MDDIVDSYPPPSRGRGRRSYSRWEVLDASNCRFGCGLAVGLLSLGVLLLVQAVTPGLEKSFLAGFWKAIFPWIWGSSTILFFICVAVVGWQIRQLVLGHRKEMMQQGLLEESLKQKRETTLLLRESRMNQDNVDIVLAEDGETVKSFKIVRRDVILEQARIASVAAVEKQAARIAQQEQKRIAGPADRGVRRVSLGAAARTWVGSVEIKSFAQLLAEGIVQDALKQGLLLLGYVGGELRYGTWLDLYSCAVGGVTGSGKTTTVRFLLFQAILAGAKLLMIDPAIHEPEESLAAQFRMFKRVHLLPPCDDDPDAVVKRIRWFWAEYVRRKKNGIKGPAYIFVLDEFNEIIALLPPEIKKELAMLLLRISQSGRKYGMFCMLIGQRWSEQDLGGKPYGSQIRTSLAAMLAHRFTDESQAQKLASSRYAADCLELDQGHFFFRDTHGNMSYTVTPDTVSSDGRTIQRLLDEIEAMGGESPFPVNVGGGADEIEENVVESETIYTQMGRPENDANEPVEPAGVTPDERPTRPVLMMNEIQTASFRALYPKIGSIDGTLDEIDGCNHRHREHARLLIEEYKLVKEKRKLS